MHRRGMAVATHPAQLRICHQPIAGDVIVHETGIERRRQFCSLRDPLVWCHDCQMYVCDIHAVSRHTLHRTAPD